MRHHSRKPDSHSAKKLGPNVKSRFTELNAMRFSIRVLVKDVRGERRKRLDSLVGTPSREIYRKFFVTYKEEQICSKQLYIMIS